MSQRDVIDFKPFFDMILGILFLLLILIAAQIFFAQSHTLPGQRSSEEAAAARRKVEVEMQVTRFLELIRDELSSRGLIAAVNRSDNEIVLPAAALLSASSGNPLAIGALGEVLYRRSSCIGGLPAAEPCAPYAALRLEQLTIEAEAGPAGAPQELVPDRRSQRAALILSAGLVVAEPRLLALSTSAGTPLLQSAARAADSALQSGGQIRLRFAFAP